MRLDLQSQTLVICEIGHSWNYVVNHPIYVHIILFWRGLWLLLDAKKLSVGLFWKTPFQFLSINWKLSGKETRILGWPTTPILIAVAFSMLCTTNYQRKTPVRNKWTPYIRPYLSLIYVTFRKLKYLDGAPMVDNYRHPQPVNNRMIKRVLRELKEESPE